MQVGTGVTEGETKWNGRQLAFFLSSVMAAKERLNQQLVPVPTSNTPASCQLRSLR